MKTEDYSFEQMAEEFDLFAKLGEILNPSEDEKSFEDEKPFNDQINF